MKHISRRKLLLQAAATAVTGALPLAASAAETNPSATSQPKPKVIVTGGHPGDPEYGCGGTIPRLTDAGHEVVLLYLNQGDPNEGPGRPASGKRVLEARKACELLKARPVFAGQIDGHAVVDAARYDQFHALLQAERPDAIFTHWPIDNHRDHRAISLLVYDAWLKMGKRFALYYYEVSNGEDTVQFAPTEYVDISATEQRKRQACYAHASQSPERFYALQQLVMRMRGLESNHPFAEAYIRHCQSPSFTFPS